MNWPFCTALGIILLLPFFGESQIIPDSQRTDWSAVGASTVFATSNRTVLTVHGADPTGQQPSDAALRRALSSLDGPGLILIPKGDYLFLEPIVLPDSVIIRGERQDESGMPEARLLLQPGEHHGIQIRGSVVETNVQVAGSAAMGQYDLVLSSEHSLRPGDLLWLRPKNDQELVTSVWASQSTGQISRIQTVAGNRISLATPLRRDFHSDSLTLLKVTPRRQVHLQCLSIERLDTTDRQTANVFFDYALDASISGIHSRFGNFSHVTIQRSAQVSIENSYFEEAHGYGSGGRGYGVMLQFTAGECLVHQNNFRRLRHSMILQAGANGNVLAYNYSREPYWTDVSLPEDSAGDLVLHGNYVYQNLMEGNVVQNIVVDASHGVNGPHNTFFRNRAEGYGLFVITGGSVGDLAFIGNQVTNTSSFFHGLFRLDDKDHLSANNWVRGNIDRPNPVAADVHSLFAYDFGSYYQHLGTIPPIRHDQIRTDIPALEAQYRLEARQPSACAEKDYSTVVLTDLKERQPLETVKVYPNPFSDHLTISGLAPGTLVQVLTMQGRIVRSEVTNSSEQTMAFGQLAAGAYLLRAGPEVKLVVRQ
jgi:hypothetical protein